MFISSLPPPIENILTGYPSPNFYVTAEFVNLYCVNVVTIFSVTLYLCFCNCYSSVYMCGCMYMLMTDIWWHIPAVSCLHLQVKCFRHFIETSFLSKEFPFSVIGMACPKFSILKRFMRVFDICLWVCKCALDRQKVREREVIYYGFAASAIWPKVFVYHTLQATNWQMSY